MIDIIYRYDPNNPNPEREPASPAEARVLLENGNRSFAHALDGIGDESVQRIIPVSASDLGLATTGQGPQAQRPFALVVGCADARVPIELILGQRANDLFVLRVAGNVLGVEVLGSIDYALHNLSDSLRLLVVLGHTTCGAVIAAADAFLDAASYLALATEHHLRSVVNHILPAIRLADDALVQIYGRDVRLKPGYRNALIDSAVVVNAGMVAATLARHVESSASSNIEVVFGVYDLETRSAGIPAQEKEGAFSHRLLAPPTDQESFTAQSSRYAASPRIRAILG
jgi:carbonic anhydrase